LSPLCIIGIDGMHMRVRRGPRTRMHPIDIDHAKR
jgi:hypothetical protein